MHDAASGRDEGLATASRSTQRRPSLFPAARLCPQRTPPGRQKKERRKKDFVALPAPIPPPPTPAVAFHLPTHRSTPDTSLPCSSVSPSTSLLNFSLLMPHYLFPPFSSPPFFPVPFFPQSPRYPSTPFTSTPDPSTLHYPKLIPIILSFHFARRDKILAAARGGPSLIAESAVGTPIRGAESSVITPPEALYVRICFYREPTPTATTFCALPDAEVT